MIAERSSRIDYAMATVAVCAMGLSAVTRIDWPAQIVVAFGAVAWIERWRR
jgi:hypothetical protein